MRRGLLALLILVAPWMTLIGTTGCEPEVKSVRSHERIEETPPQMTSPGEPVVE